MGRHLLWILLGLMTALGSCQWRESDEERIRAERFSEILRQDSLNALRLAEQDSLDSIRKAVKPETQRKSKNTEQPKKVKKNSESRYQNDGHPGTKPDDGLFGFDPWDDEDDAYHMERNQIDPYPGEW